MNEHYECSVFIEWKLCHFAPKLKFVNRSHGINNWVHRAAVVNWVSTKHSIILNGIKRREKEREKGTWTSLQKSGIIYANYKPLLLEPMTGLQQRQQQTEEHKHNTQTQTTTESEVGNRYPS